MTISTHVTNALQAACMAINNRWQMVWGCWRKSQSKLDSRLSLDRLRDIVALLSEAIPDSDTALFEGLKAAIQGEPRPPIMRWIIRIETGFDRIRNIHVQYVVRALVLKDGQPILYESRRLISWLALPSDVRKRLIESPREHVYFRVL